MSTRREGAANLNDMKDMLANLPQYKEQREKVRPFCDYSTLGSFAHGFLSSRCI